MFIVCSFIATSVATVPKLFNLRFIGDYCSFPGLCNWPSYSFDSIVQSCWLSSACAYYWLVIYIWGWTRFLVDTICLLRIIPERPSLESSLLLALLSCYLFLSSDSKVSGSFEKTGLILLSFVFWAESTRKPIELLAGFFKYFSNMSLSVYRIRSAAARALARSLDSIASCWRLFRWVSRTPAWFPLFGIFRNGETLLFLLTELLDRVIEPSSFFFCVDYLS